MSSQTGNPPSQADLDRQMLDVNRAIAGNPQDWKAYRDRGWIYAHKHEFDRALADLDMALRLKPDDARAYARRGHIWMAAGQRQKAIADYEAAMRLDPANADAYRDMIRKAQGGENANTTTSAASTPKPQTTPAPASSLTGFFKRLAPNGRVFRTHRAQTDRVLERT